MKPDSHVDSSGKKLEEADRPQPLSRLLLAMLVVYVLWLCWLAFVAWINVSAGNQ